MTEGTNGNGGNSDAQRALDEIRDLRRVQAEAAKEQTAALNAINTKLGHIEGMVGGQAEGNANRDRRVTDLERRVERNETEIAALKLDLAKAAAGGAPQRVAELERRAERSEAEIAGVHLEVATAKAGGAPLQRIGWAVIIAIVLGFGGLIAANIVRPQSPPNITIQMPASAAP